MTNNSHTINGLRTLNLNNTGKQIGIQVSNAALANELWIYPGSWPTNNLMNRANCSSVGWNMAQTLSIRAAIMIWKDFPNVISASSSAKEYFAKRAIIRASLFIQLLLRYLVNMIAIWDVKASNEQLWHSLNSLR